MIYLYSALVILCILLTAGFLFFRTKSPSPISLVLKTLSSLTFVLIGIISLINSKNTVTNAMIILGLFLGLIGDILLDLKVMEKDNKLYLNFGTLSFALGHVMYFFAILCYISDKTVTGFWWVVLFAAVFSLICGFMVVKFSPSLKLDLTGFKWQSGLYTSILLFMVIISLCLGLVIPIALILFAGFTLFFASDLVLSIQYFGGKQQNKTLTIVNHVLYYMAQLLIASFIFFI